ncbi:MAG: prepilin-type N-terminal cleavage/methylation domain-containing protein [Desulfobacterales bacterium]|nr:prepilin-type N-terminal cleavage/methylation domain-containing protein [Desulfobacterales bacterium]
MEYKKMKEEHGFTLVELMVAVAILSLVLAGIYDMYINQIRAYVNQDRAITMQQNAKGAMFILEKEIRTMGCDPFGALYSVIVSPILQANANSIQFTSDLTGGETDLIDNDGDGNVDEPDERRFSDGDVNDLNENITYSLMDFDGNGITDLVRTDLNAPAPLNTPQLVAENIELLNFIYYNNASPPVILDDTGTGTINPSPVGNMANIDSIQITLIARTAAIEERYDNTRVYEIDLPNGVVFAPDNNAARPGVQMFMRGAPNDDPRGDSRRMLITKRIKIRN